MGKFGPVLHFRNLSSFSLIFPHLFSFCSKPRKQKEAEKQLQSLKYQAEQNENKCGKMRENDQNYQERTTGPNLPKPIPKAPLFSQKKRKKKKKRKHKKIHPTRVPGI